MITASVVRAKSARTLSLALLIIRCTYLATSSISDSDDSTIKASWMGAFSASPARVTSMQARRSTSAEFA